MSKRRRGKQEAGKHQPAGPISFPLSLGWVVSRTVIIPPLILVMPVVLLGALAQSISSPAVFGAAVVAFGAIAGLMIAVRVPLVLYTLLFDRYVVLGKEELHVPILGLFQFRPWNIPIRDIVTMVDKREPGSSTKLVLAIKGGRTLSFYADLIKDRTAVVRAVERRIRQGTY
jgi:hypothetical protein